MKSEAEAGVGWVDCVLHPKDWFVDQRRIDL